MRLSTRSGAQFPLWFNDLYSYISVATAAYNPFAVYDASAKAKADETALLKLVKNGFGVKNATDASVDIYVITWEQYQNFLTTRRETPYDPTLIAALTPRHIQLGAGEWCLTPVVKVLAANDGDYTASAGATYLQIGLIL